MRKSADYADRSAEIGKEIGRIAKGTIAILSYVCRESSIRRCEFKANFRSGSKEPRLEMNEAAQAGTSNYIFHSNVPIARSRIADTVRGFPWDLNS